VCRSSVSLNALSKLSLPYRAFLCVVSWLRLWQPEPWPKNRIDAVQLRIAWHGYPSRMQHREAKCLLCIARIVSMIFSSSHKLRFRIFSGSNPCIPLGSTQICILCITTGANREGAIKDNRQKCNFLATPLSKFPFADTLRCVLKTTVLHLASIEWALRLVSEIGSSENSVQLHAELGKALVNHFPCFAPTRSYDGVMYYRSAGFTRYIEVQLRGLE
jgi:hypothetical protein